MATVPSIAQRFDLPADAAAFVKAMVRGQTPKAAALAAGAAEDQGYAWLRSPRVAAAIEDEMWRVLKTEAAPEALQTARDLLAPGIPHATRAIAAKLILDKAGYSPAEKSSHSEQADADLSAMSVDQLKDYLGKKTAEIDRLEGELALRAKPVAAPDSAPNTDDRQAEATDLLD